MTDIPGRPKLSQLRLPQDDHVLSFLELSFTHLTVEMDMTACDGNSMHARSISSHPSHHKSHRAVLFLELATAGPTPPTPSTSTTAWCPPQPPSQGLPEYFGKFVNICCMIKCIFRSHDELGYREDDDDEEDKVVLRSSAARRGRVSRSEAMAIPSATRKESDR